jgi:lipopolysaccharide biosynthesis protein/glycosyltransferase involved in cell wall biosynthesis
MLCKLFVEHAGYVSDKWEHYLPIYQSAFAGLIARGEPVRVLEIGVQNGGSLQIWSKYFPEGSTIVGIDIDPACASLAVEPHISIRIGDASSPATLDRLLGKAQFDVIIDDGSHRSDQIVSTFRACFERLGPSGFYIVEDLHCSYWKSHGGGFRLANAAIEEFKILADALNADHFESDAASNLDSSELERLQRLGRETARISFYDSMVIVEKLTIEKYEPYRRVLTGRESHVVDVASALSTDPHAIRTLLLTHEAAKSFTPALLEKLASAGEEVGRLRAELVQRREEAEQLRGELVQRREEAEQLRGELVQRREEAKQLRADKNRLITEQKEKIVRAEAVLVHRDRELAEKHAELAQKEAVLGEQSDRLALMRSQLESVSAEHDRAEITIAYISERYGSLSRKRFFKALRRRIRFALSRPPVRRKLYEIISSSIFFDKYFYTNSNPDVRAAQMDPVVHYLLFGSKEGRDPSPHFSETGYHTRYPDLTASGLSAIEHYERYGRAERRRTVNPVSAGPAPQAINEGGPFEGIAGDIFASQQSESAKLAEKMQKALSCQQLIRRRVARTIKLALRKANLGLRQREDLNLIVRSGLLDPDWYLSRYSDVRASGMDPALHYLKYGALEGRDPGPQCVRQREDLNLIVRSGLFDPDWYLSRYPDVRALGIDPALHYLKHGASEGRDPGPQFNSASYLSQHPDAAAADVNPLLHYVRYAAAYGHHSRGMLSSHDIEVRAKSPFRAIPCYIDPADTWCDPPVLTCSRVAVHLHIFYFNLLDDFICRLRSIPFAFDLFVSMPYFALTAQAAQIERALREGLPRAGQILIKQVPNRGRDIAPFIIEFGNNLLDYDIIGHFHTKRSPHNPALEGWRDTILDLLLGPVGNPGGHVSWIFGMLEKNAKIIYPEGPVLIRREATGWAGNYAIARDILTNHTDVSISDFPTVEFAEGTMQWARSAALRQFLNLPLTYDDFPPEPIAADGTLGHALERLVFILAQTAEGDLIRLHKGDSISDHRFFEEAQDFSTRLAHTDVKVLAYYLPQFHPIPENDDWHGVGFTEWTKVRAANPLFRGHYQQHIPHPDVGYYFLDSPGTLRRQAADMKRAGVYGQIFYHYWFGSKLILERTAQMLLTNTDIDMSFCFCWANENWTRRWDGSEDQILLKQDYSAHDARAFIRYLIPFFNDARYIKVEGRPVLFIYRPTSIPMVSVYLAIWREECEAAGLKRPYTVATLAAGASDARAFDMDAGVERVLYDWTDGKVPDITSELDAYTPLKGRVFSYESIKEHYASQPIEMEFTCFRSLVPNWDNTARYGASAHVLHGGTPRLFQEWLEILIAQTKRALPRDRRFVVVNAWNEWAEGTHLEADTRYGYAYLNAVGRALANEPLSEPARDSFQALAIAEAAEHAGHAGAMMVVTHRLGGGTERHVHDMVNALDREGVVVFLTRVAVDRPNWVVVERAGADEGLELCFFNVDASPGDYALLLRRLHVRLVHVQHLADFPQGTADWMQRACAAADILYDVTLHDYMAVCPRIVMVTAANKYCGEPPLSQCELCIATDGSPFGQPSVANWRARYGRFLRGARRRFVPSDDVAERLSRYFPRMNFTVRPHPEPHRNNARLTALQSKWLSGKASIGAAFPGAKRHVVVIGHIGGHKGFDILLNSARFAERTQAPIRFTIVGATDRDSDFDSLDNVTILGRYNPSELLDIIERQSPDIAFLPSTCPETYSFTLSETVVAGIYPVVFDLGAVGARVRSLGWGDVLPAAWITDPEAVVKALLNAMPTPPPPAVFKLAHGVGYPKILRDYYELEWPWMAKGQRPDYGTRRAVTKARLREASFVAPSREAALFVTHSADGSLKPHVPRYVSAVTAVGISVYLIVAADLPSQTQCHDTCRDAAGLFIRDNEGYDFAAWTHVIREHPEFKGVDILYLVNDSVIGPLDHDCFSSAIARVRSGGAQVYGMTENFEQGWHLQSYFLAIKQPALRSGAFDEFFDSVVKLSDKQTVIGKYEISFASKMTEAGFQVQALFTLPSERNMTIYHWEELVRLGFPFVKIQVGRDEIAGVDRKAVRQFLENSGFSSNELNAIFGKRPK